MVPEVGPGEQWQACSDARRPHAAEAGKACDGSNLYVSVIESDLASSIYVATTATAMMAF